MNLDAEAIFAKIEADEAARAERMPTERDAIRTMFDAWQRLKELGWRDGQHMPLDGKRHAGIQCGSTGIHAYTGERQEARPLSLPLYMMFDGELWPSRTAPVLFREWRDTDVQANYRPTYLGMVGSIGEQHD